MYFGEFLIKNSVITDEQLKEGLTRQNSMGLPIGETLVSLGFMSREQLNKYLEEHMLIAADKITNDSDLMKDIDTT